MNPHRRLAAIMFTDIAGYSALMSIDEKRAMDILEINRTIHKKAISRHNGDYIKEVGDGTLAIFHSSLEAVGCALEIHHACCRESGLKVRIGIHIGDIILRDGDVFGDGVNIASRIEATGEPGGIYISERVYEDIKNKQDIRTEFLGERILKNIDIPVKIYSINPEASTLPIKRLSRLTRKASTTPIQYEVKKAGVKKTGLIAALVIILLTAIIIFLFVLPVKKQQIINNRIAVAVFENRTTDPAMDVFGKITADWISQGLSRSEEIEVVPSTNVMQIFETCCNGTGGGNYNQYLSVLARETKAEVMVSGYFYLQKETLQFQAEVKNVSDGSLIYSLAPISGSIEKPMELIEKLSSEIIGGLSYHIRFSDVRNLSKPPNKDAYVEYLTGLELFGYDYPEAMRHLGRAMQLDSLFMSPKAYIAMAHSNRGEYARADSIIRIISYHRERLTAVENHITDYLIAHLLGKNAECYHHLCLARKRAPSSHTIKYLVGLYAFYLNKPGKTVDIYSKVDLQSSYLRNSVLGEWQIGIMTDALHLLGDYEEELKQARYGQQLYPDNLGFYSDEVGALSAMNRSEDIKTTIERCSSLSSGNSTVGDVIITAALELRAHGHGQEAQAYASKAVEWYRSRPGGEDIREDLAFALYHAEMWEEAQTVYHDLAAEFHDNINYLGYLGALSVRLGDTAGALRISEQLQGTERPYLFGLHTYGRARIMALLGEKDKAVELLRESFAQGRKYGIYLHRTIDFESLKGYPPFEELLKPDE